MHRLRALSATLGLALLLAGIDQGVKWLVVRDVERNGPHALIPHVLDLHLAYNTGAAFSMLRNAQPWLLLLLSAGVLVLFFVLVWPHLTQWRGVAAAALILGGALGNMIDRVRLHEVVDFLDVHIWPIFNVADSCIVLGVAVLLLVIFRAERRPSPPMEGASA